MCWKKMSYWLKGGIILTVILFVILLIGMFFSIYSDVQAGNGFKIINFFDAFFTMFLWIPFLIIAFLIGALIGWIYGKINRKNLKINKRR